MATVITESLEASRAFISGGMGVGVGITVGDGVAVASGVMTTGIVVGVGFAPQAIASTMISNKGVKANHVSFGDQ